jgi:hypothetical protein
MTFLAPVFSVLRASSRINKFAEIPPIFRLMISGNSLKKAGFPFVD